MYEKTMIRHPVSFWRAGPFHSVSLSCNHEFHSRTSIEINDTVWCITCQTYRSVTNNLSKESDLELSFQQDKNIIRERIARYIRDNGFIENDDITDTAVQFGVAEVEVRRINAALQVKEEFGGLPSLGKHTSGGPISSNYGKLDLCAAGIHAMSMDNIAITRGRRQCKACKLDRQRERRAAKRQELT
jgi:hypothetical protein